MNARTVLSLVLLAGVAVTGSSCGGGTPPPTPAPTATPTVKASVEPVAETEEPLPFQLDTQLSDAVSAVLLKPFTGDLDEMVKRRLVRIGVTANRTFYFVDKGVQRGIAYEYGRLVEDRLNERFNPDKKHDQRIHVVFVPLQRGKLLPALTEGRVDLVGPSSR